MSERWIPKEGDRVIAATSIDIDHPAWITFAGTDDDDFWRWPLEDHVVEELAKVSYVVKWEGYPSVVETPWEDLADWVQESWRKTVRAIFARLMDGTGI